MSAGLEDPTEFAEFARIVQEATMEDLAELGEYEGDLLASVAILLMDAGIRAGALERVRQIAMEGWDAEHDDQHNERELASAAIAYVQATIFRGNSRDFQPAAWWPYDWDRAWFKPTTPKRNIEKAIALLAAEWGRLDRIELREAQG